MVHLLKKLFYLMIILLIFLNNYFASLSLNIYIFGIIFLTFTYYWYKKLQIFLRWKVKHFEETKMLSSEMRYSHVCKLPVIWSTRLHYKNSPFLEACQNGDLKSIKFLLQNGNVNVHETNIFGEGAIFLATFNLLNTPSSKDVSCIWFLHQIGCSVNVKNRDGFTPLHLATFDGHCRLIIWLIKKGANVNIKPCPAGLALIRGHKKAAAIILSQQYKLPIQN